MADTLLKIELPDQKFLKRGKVRDIYDLGENLLIVASDRISAFDYIMQNGIPDKGRILTQISAFWFNYTRDIIANHIISTDSADFPGTLKNNPVVDKRSMLVKKCKVVPVECVVRGYISGSGWKEYQQSQSICGIKLTAGLKESDKLPEPIFTPTTKAEEGHDLPITFDQVKDQVGSKLAEEIKNKSIEVYKKAAEYASTKGMIIADTKFEFGQMPDGSVILIDEILTPDSSRFWPADQYRPGGSQPSYDKQFVRDYLESIKWNKQPPAPKLPDDVVQKTREKYMEAYKKLTGKDVL
ncbi:MAG: phosphoribosylaminoimidazolesuccinocarboxamide synthase [Candidatus Margulisbacteria bacterium]|nr:phosphoribosylaminoimidazolesuccinocarboxamide synthase [Candidatus Margulisiibacteriota bacterium]